MDERIFMLERGKRTDSPGLDRIGGLPPSLGGKRWPLTEDDEPLVHLVSMDISGRKPAPKGKRGVSVFVKSLSDIDRFDEGDEDPRDVVVRWWSDEHLTGAEPKPPPKTVVLDSYALKVEPWLEVKADAQRVQLLYQGKVVAQSEIDESQHLAYARALEDAVNNEGGANVSYLGGEPVNPSGGPREPSKIAGPFVARFAEHLFSSVGGRDSRPNFAGGGFLLVFEKDGWVEQ
jgi:hypothetical protein